MKSNKLIALVLFAALALSACGTTTEETIQDTTTENVEGVEKSGHNDSMSNDPMQKRVKQRCEEIVSLYSYLYSSADKAEPQNQWDEAILSQSSIDSIEDILIEAGLDVVDTNGAYPSYLITADRFYEFWDSVTQQENAEQEIITIRDSGALLYCLFRYRDGVPYIYSMIYYMVENTDPYYEQHQILDWELTEKGNFYYRIYPADDKHYADFSLIRLVEPDLALWDLNLEYIMAGGYIATNIFLTDWTEDNFGNLSFNDLWEYLYHDYYGEQFCPDGYNFNLDQCFYEIPAAEFEKVVMPYFNIDLDTFREMAQYKAEGDYYPWRQVETNDYVFLYYFMIEPEVTAYQVNADGTITLTVEMLSTDLKTDCLFAHEVTVRPLDNGKFQFVGNKMTYITEYGLPFCEPRLTWKNR